MVRSIALIILAVLLQASRPVPPGYHTYEEIIALEDSLAQNFPGICKKVLYGTSLGGRQLAALKISDNAGIDETEPEILLDAGAHGDEVGGPENLIRFARDLCLGYGTDSVITDLVNTREIWLYVMVNPDGRVAMSRFNDAVVDINRDYGYMWNGAGSSPFAFSQPESKGVRACLEEHPFSIYISYHSGFQQVAYPWAYRSGQAPDLPNLYTLAMNYSSCSLYPFLLYGQSWNIMYEANGMSVDYAYGALGVSCFTMELSADKQPADPVFYYLYNYPAMVEMIREAGWGIEGTVQDSETGSPVPATIWVDEFYPVNNNPVAGDFHKYVLPGVHSLRVTANGYQSQIIPNVVTPAGGSVSVPVSLVPDTGWYGVRVCSCSIPGDPAADERYTPGALSVPDQVACSVGKGGWIVIDLGDTLGNAEGYDLTVVEAGPPDEGFSCYSSLSEDGPWTLLGNATGTAGFDLGPGITARYIKILDDGDGASGIPDEGYDLDALVVPSEVYSATNDPPVLSDLLILPNPSDGDFTLMHTGNLRGRISVTDLTGRTVLSGPLIPGPNRIDLTGRPAGPYFYRAEISGTLQSGILLVR